MMVLIMANINYLVILICSTVFLLSSFVSSQQKSKNAGDPREFYNYAVYLRTHHPEYYAKNYYGIIGHYNKLISATEAKRNRSYGGISKNNRKLKRNGPSVPNGQPSPSVSTTPTIITTPTTTTSDATQPLTTLTSTTEARATIEVANVSVPPNGTSLVEN
ncbi:uncharacterized protein LOC107366865 [Tetranychus urticae]|uniref:uncharacterized protein LOC107366865 n=1 Tax=Tetranychus urticae TaxID=32264 RepID=UPI00077B948D|nr:uncharacterized protein LOC107366865 [Tetranychus urticae]